MSKMSELSYDQYTGIFTRLAPQKPTRGVRNCLIGKPAGTPDARGYIIIGIAGKRYKAHRLAYLFMTGKWPDGEVDHKNHIHDDNIWENLREVDHHNNSKNLPKKTSNTSGHTGVFWDKILKKWRASITVNYKTKYLGCFVEKADAVVARKNADIEHNFHPNHGE